MTINGLNAVITYDSDIDLFRGEFVGLNGGADFYAADAEGLRREGEISLKVFGCGSFRPKISGYHAAILSSSFCGTET